MKSDNVVQSKSYTFALRIVRLYQHLCAVKKEYVLSKQVLRCGTSIGANVEEAIGGQSRADFVSKMSVAYKEARETSYWLRLLKDTDYLTTFQFNNIHGDVDELCRIIASIQKSKRQRGNYELRIENYELLHNRLSFVILNS
jgi:four helix bundle protein